MKVFAYSWAEAYLGSMWLRFHSIGGYPGIQLSGDYVQNKCVR